MINTMKKEIDTKLFMEFKTLFESKPNCYFVITNIGRVGDRKTAYMLKLSPKNLVLSLINSACRLDYTLSLIDGTWRYEDKLLTDLEIEEKIQQLQKIVQDADSGKAEFFEVTAQSQASLINTKDREKVTSQLTDYIQSQHLNIQQLSQAELDNIAAAGMHVSTYCSQNLIIQTTQKSGQKNTTTLLKRNGITGKITKIDIPTRKKPIRGIVKWYVTLRAQHQLKHKSLAKAVQYAAKKGLIYQDKGGKLHSGKLDLFHSQQDGQGNSALKIVEPPIIKIGKKEIPTQSLQNGIVYDAESQIEKGVSIESAYGIALTPYQENLDQNTIVQVIDSTFMACLDQVAIDADAIKGVYQLAPDEPALIAMVASIAAKGELSQIIPQSQLARLNLPQPIQDIKKPEHLTMRKTLAKLAYQSPTPTLVNAFKDRPESKLLFQYNIAKNSSPAIKMSIELELRIKNELVLQNVDMSQGAVLSHLEKIDAQFLAQIQDWIETPPANLDKEVSNLLDKKDFATTLSKLTVLQAQKNLQDAQAALSSVKNALEKVKKSADPNPVEIKTLEEAVKSAKYKEYNSKKELKQAQNTIAYPGKIKQGFHNAIIKLVNDAKN